MGRKTSVTYAPDSGNVQRSESWHYDTAGRTDTFTNRNGKVQTFTYDALNRTTGFSWEKGKGSVLTFDTLAQFTKLTHVIPYGVFRERK